ncbi:hypothetical protein PSTG_18257, partial [Puccinia striiformis f. sp. tritici PST-78]
MFFIALNGFITNKSCPQDNDPTNPPAQSSPILVDDGFVTVEEELSEAEGSKTNFYRGSVMDNESDIEADNEDGYEDALNKRHAISKRSWPKRAPQNNSANLGARDFTDEETDSSPDRNQPSTSSRPSGAPTKLTKHQKCIHLDKKKGSSKPKRESLRKERKAMETEDEDDDKNL